MNGWDQMMKEFLEAFKSISWRIWMKKLLLVAVVCVCVFGGCSYLNKKFGLDDDNPIEEAIEGVIENKTGIDVDLSP